MADALNSNRDDALSAYDRDPARSLGTRFGVGRILAVTALLAPIIGFGAPNGLAPLLVVSGLAVVVSGRWLDGRWPRPPVGLVVLASVLVAWCLLSALWTINLPDTLGKLPRFVVLLAAGLALIDASRRLAGDDRRRLARNLAVGLVSGVALMVGDRLTGGAVREAVIGRTLDRVAFLNVYNASATLTAMFVWPLMARAAGIHRVAVGALWLAALGVVLSLISEAAILAVVLGAVAFVIAALAPRAGPAAIAGLIALFVMVAPVLPPSQADSVRFFETNPEIPRSGYHRLLIWRFVADRIAERPILGWGFNSSRAIPGGKVHLDRNESALPLHPHNAALQWWLELGVPGAALGAALVLWLGRATVRAEAPLIGRASASGLLVATATICFLSYGIWQSWWIAALWLAGAFMTALIRAGPAPQRRTPDTA